MVAPVSASRIVAGELLSGSPVNVSQPATRTSASADIGTDIVSRPAARVAVVKLKAFIRSLLKVRRGEKTERLAE
jgi:hypothetical protein